MKTFESQFTIFKPHEHPLFNVKESALIQYCDMFSSITTESFYVLDIPRKQFCYLNPDDYFICSFFVEDALGHGYDFYNKIVYPEDLALWKEMYNAVLRYIRYSDEKRDEIDYFSCTFRLQRKFSLQNNLLPQMVFHRMKHIWEDDKLRYLICSIGSSTAKKPGNLRMYKKDGLTFEEYNRNVKRWDQKAMELLTEREKAILVLAQQGKTTNEIANDLHKGFNTIRNQIKTLFSKLEVHSMQEAIEFVYNHHMIYMKQNRGQQSIETSKRTRVLLSEEMLQRIQQYLYHGKSIRQAARLEGVTESAIRYWKEKGKLELCKQT
ncbi:LuxR C-terminal-related transcriptional regulator [Proteiniphilum sp. UBA5346]|uniref:LuxR C-terminal-related transcriptional regulator n=1 Tax=Proteiniphilum sp. UBA5346 TaxID=1947277 RepID=UPI00257AC293|nr:LuxR C-terminal-related transcriptional regulator [Proteiniphilum sp. UBA5346]